MNVESGRPFEAVYAHGGSGLVPGLEVAVIDNDGNTVIGPTAADIAEQIVDGTPTGIYVWNAPAAPAIIGQYSLVWSPLGDWNALETSVDELVVVPIGTSTLPGIPVDEGDELSVGPCSTWTTPAEVVAFCASEDVDSGSDIYLLDEAVIISSQELYAASGKQFAGICENFVRPCSDGCSCGYQVLSRGHLVGWDGECWGGYACGCHPEPRVKLAGYVREILEVTIDGIVVDPSLYRVDKNKYLVRTDGSRWPSCQTLELNSDEVGTFAVSYTYGRIPPLMGQMAARQLACEIFKDSSGLECALPTGVTRVTRQGITFERSFFQRDPDGLWRTGMALVDMFLNTVNPHGLSRRGTFWSPASRGRYARRASA